MLSAMNDCIRVNEHDLYVETQGPEDGPPLVFLHHGLGSTRAWKAQMPFFAQAGYRAIAYDRWGYGSSAPRPKLSMPFFYDDLADLEALLDQLGVNRVSLVGHSDGGTISLYFSAKNPERVSSLVVASAHIYVEPKMDTGIQAVRESYENEPAFRQALERIHGEKVESMFWGWFHGWHAPENLNWDIRPVLRRIEAPALVMQGAEDEHATDQHAADIAAAIPEARLVILPVVGHMLPQDAPYRFNEQVLSFLHETSAPAV